MIEGSHEFRLCAEEVGYLKQLASRDESFARLLRLHDGLPARKVVIRLNDVQANQLRDYLTAQLAAAGFDKNYAPNNHGQMLENLIDKFFIP